MAYGADNSIRHILPHQSQADPNGIALYVHFPFCSKICGYCDFHKEILDRRKEKVFFEALALETDLAAEEYISSLSLDSGADKAESQPEKPALASLYIGGGTPSLADPDLFAAWIARLGRYFELTDETEFTVELNPESSHKDNLENFRQLGVNRISIGVQSFDRQALSDLDRLHKVHDTLRVFYLARALGFEDFSADVMFGYQRQTLNALISDLTQLIELEPTHVSFYQLTVKENTPLAAQVSSGAVCLPESDTMAVFYRAGVEFLSEHGYSRYEISSFAKDGHIGKHNSRYWTGLPYLALGPGAHGFNGIDRYQIAPDTAEYTRSLLERGSRPLIWDRLTPRKRMIEDIMLSLRMTRGIDKREFSNRHGSPVTDALDESEFARLVESGYVVPDGAFIRLSDEAFALADEIIARLIA